MSRRLRFVAVFLVVLSLAGCGTGVVRREVEESVAARLPQLIGPAESYQVTAYGSSLRMLRGSVDRLHIVGKDVVLENGIVVERLVIDAASIRVDPDTNRITRAGETTYQVEITEQALTQYLAGEYPDIDDLDVGLGRGDLRISARPGVSILSTNVQATAQVEVRRERILALDMSTLKVAGVRTPGIARNFIASRFGTIYDAAGLGYDARIKSAAVTPGLLTLKGTLDLTQQSPSARRPS